MTAFVVLAAVAAAGIEGAAAGATSGAVQEANAVATNVARSSPWTCVQGIANGVRSYYKSSGASQLDLAQKFASNFPINVKAILYRTSRLSD